MIRTEHNDKKYEFPFVSYVPENASGKLPVIFQLHGAGEAGMGSDELYKVENYGFPQFFKTGEIPCILILPQCPTDSFWAAHIESLRSFIDSVRAEFDIDDNRIYLTGVSMGGFGTWFTALAFPELFAAIVPVCGGGMTWKAPVLQMPIWAFHGADDEVVDPRETMQMILKVRQTSANDVRMTIFDKTGHDSWIKAYTPELLEWLLSKSK